MTGRRHEHDGTMYPTATRPRVISGERDRDVRGHHHGTTW